jgi:signal transduction histidine kinase
VWNEQEALVDFVIAPAYYQTVWFRVDLAVMVVVLCWAMYRLRMRRIAANFDLRLDERVNERMRIARELHDTLLQSFQGLMLRFQGARDLLPADPSKAAEALDRALERGDDALAEGRDAIQNLRSSATPASDLTEAMTALAGEFARGPASTALPVAFRASLEGTPRQLHPLLRDDVYRIACEALRNAYRHARASHIEAEVVYGARELRVCIRDDGRGIDPQYLKTAPAGHWGLTSMRERARQIKSELRLWSERGAGTEVELRIPGAVAYGASAHRSLLARMLRKDVADGG